MNSQPSTIHKIMNLCRKLDEGDRLRILRFVEGIVSSRQQKRSSRRKRLEKSAIEDWRIGS